MRYQYQVTIWNEKASHNTITGVEGLGALLNDRGAEGWELVAVVPRPNGDLWHHFKHPVHGKKTARQLRIVSGVPLCRPR